MLAAPSDTWLGEDQTCLATAFKEAGYTTGAIHSAFLVSGYFGFDNDFIDEFQSFDAAMTFDEDGNMARWDIERRQRPLRRDHQRRARVVHPPPREGDAPVFLWLHYWDPHDPVLLPPEDELSASSTTVDRGAAR